MKVIGVVLALVTSAIAQEMHARASMLFMDESYAGIFMFDQNGPNTISMNRMNMAFPPGKYAFAVHEYEYENRRKGLGQIGLPVKFNDNDHFFLFSLDLNGIHASQVEEHDQPTLIPNQINSITGRALVAYNITTMNDEDPTDSLIGREVAYGFVDAYATVPLYFNHGANRYHAGTIDFIQPHPDELIVVNAFFANLPLGWYIIGIHEKNHTANDCSDLGPLLRLPHIVDSKLYKVNRLVFRVVTSRIHVIREYRTNMVTFLPHVTNTITGRSIALHAVSEYCKNGNYIPIRTVACGNAE